MAANQYPIDYDAVEKGDEWTGKELEKIFGCKGDSKEFQFARLQLQQEIWQRRQFTVKIHNETGLRVLTDPEASVHNQKQFRHNLLGVHKRTRMLLAVDRGNLSEVQQTSHDRAVRVQGYYSQHLAAASKSLHRFLKQKTSRPRKPIPPDALESGE